VGGIALSRSWLVWADVSKFHRCVWILELQLRLNHSRVVNLKGHSVFFRFRCRRNWPDCSDRALLAITRRNDSDQHTTLDSLHHLAALPASNCDRQKHRVHRLPRSGF
jgi:hypothetical protein